VERERAAIFEQAHREIEAVTGEMNALVARTDSRVNAVVSDTDERMNALVAQTDARAGALVDRLLVGIALVGAVLILLAAGAVWLVRRAERKPPGSAGRAVRGGEAYAAR
jgi:hypothetical protein